MHHRQISFLDSDRLSGRVPPGLPPQPGRTPVPPTPKSSRRSGEGISPPVSPPPPAEGRQRAPSEACLSPPRGDSRLPDHDEVPTVSRRGRILRSGAESQRIAVRQLLNRLQHPGRYVSRLQTVRCGHTARGSYLHSGGRSPAFPGSAEFPLHGLVTGRLTVL